MRKLIYPFGDEVRAIILSWRFRLLGVESFGRRSARSNTQEARWRAATANSASPFDSVESRDGIEMAVLTHQWKGVLTTECGNPEIICGNRLAHLFQFHPNLCVMLSGSPFDRKHIDGGDPIGEPRFVSLPMAGMQDPKAIFTDDNHRNCEAVTAIQELDCGRRAIGCGGQGIRVENQRHISKSIFSACSSITRLMSFVSLRKCFNLPTCFSQGFCCGVE